MRKQYTSPEFELTKFNFEQMLAGDDDDTDGFGYVTHSAAQGIGEGGGEF